MSTEESATRCSSGDRFATIALARAARCVLARTRGSGKQAGAVSMGPVLLGAPNPD